MRVEISHIPDCPNFVEAGARVRLSLGVDATQFTPSHVRWSSAIRDVSFEPSDSPSVWLCAALDLLMS